MKNFIHYVSHSVAAMIGISIYILADTYFIASYAGTDGLAVLNLVLPLYGLMNALGSMLGIGSATRYSIRKARGKDVSSFFCSLFFGMPFSVSPLCFAVFSSPGCFYNFLAQTVHFKSWESPMFAPFCPLPSSICRIIQQPPMFETTIIPL